MLFLQQLRGELRKLFARPRTWMGYGAFLLMEAVILFVYKLPRSQSYMKSMLERNGLDFNTFYSSLTITFTIMLLSMFLLGSIYFALVAGDSFSSASPVTRWLWPPLAGRADCLSWSQK